MRYNKIKGVENMPEIKIKLAEILKERGLTQTRLAEISGVRQASISSMVRNNTAMLSLEMMAKIMKALEINSVDELLEYVD